MRWGRRRFATTPKKLHYIASTDVNGNPVATCKKEYDSSSRLTTDVYMVNCKTCIKKMVKDGIIALDDVPLSLQPSTISKKEVVSEEDYKNDYLKRLGVF